MGPYLITAKLTRPSNMKRFPTPGIAGRRGRDLNPKLPEYEAGKLTTRPRVGWS
jgi:hypothetical protein